MKRVFLVILIPLLSITIKPLFPCTIVMVSGGGVILFGNNEDGSHPFTKIWFIPSHDETYGRVGVGFDDKLEYPFCQGGMNDQGLCVDGTRVRNIDWEHNANLLDYDTSGPLWGNLCDHILANFATVGEVIEFFETHNIDYLRRVKFAVADKTGSMAVIEWSNSRLQVIRKTFGFLVATNFVQSDYEPARFVRYEIAENMLSRAGEFSVDLIRKVLFATHVRNAGETLYSNIFNPKNGNIYLYNFHDFENVIKLNLKEELKKGKTSHSITILFPNPSFLHHNYLKVALLQNLRVFVDSSNTENHYYNKYTQLKHIYKDNFKLDINISENAFNNFGYQLLRIKEYEKAINIFKINITEYPSSWNAYNGLGEAFAQSGNIEKAIKNYERSISLNPKNKAGKKALESLYQKKDKL